MSVRLIAGSGRWRRPDRLPLRRRAAYARLKEGLGVPMRALAGLAVAVSTCAGCALSPEFISGSYIGGPYYDRLSCRELAIARTNVRKELALASRQQSRFVGVVFPSGEYRRNTEKIAELKGTLTAIDNARTVGGCLPSGASDAGEAAALQPSDADADGAAAAEADDIGAGEAGW